MWAKQLLLKAELLVRTLKETSNVYNVSANNSLLQILYLTINICNRTCMEKLYDNKRTSSYYNIRIGLKYRYWFRLEWSQRKWFVLLYHFMLSSTFLSPSVFSSHLSSMSSVKHFIVSAAFVQCNLKVV